MSHEGIRIVSGEEARPPARKMPACPQDAVTPLKVRVKKTEGTGVEIDWRDGHKSAWTFRWLRDACPCATCHEEREKSGRAPGEPKPKAQALLMMYQEPPRPSRSYARSASTPSGSNGTTATRPGSTPGTTCAASASATVCKPPRS